MLIGGRAVETSEGQFLGNETCGSDCFLHPTLSTSIPFIYSELI